jgi:hypothetical protein
MEVRNWSGANLLTLLARSCGSGELFWSLKMELGKFGLHNLSNVSSAARRGFFSLGSASKGPVGYRIR